MNNHVNGHFTPMTIGELRQSILAVVVGNMHFSDVEQLQLNHTAHECEDEGLLANCLRQVRMLDAERGHLEHLKAHWCHPVKQAVCRNKRAQLDEMQDLLACRGLHPHQKGIGIRLIADPDLGPETRLRLIGDAYFTLLHNVGYQEVPNRRAGLCSN